MTINSNLFLEFLSLHQINWYVEKTTRLNSYVPRVLDKDIKSPFLVPLMAS